MRTEIFVIILDKIIIDMKFIIGFTFLILSQNLQSQIFENFEFLDHRERQSKTGALGIFNGEIVYVSHNNQWPMTTVSTVNNKNELNLLFESYYTSRSKIIKHSDTKFDIYLYSLFDYDIHVPGFIRFRVDQDQISIDTVRTPETEEYNWSETASGVVQDSVGIFWITNFDGLYKIDNGKIIESIDTISLVGANLYINQDDDIFNYGPNNIAHIFENKIFILFETVESIYDIKRYGQLNLVLSRDSLRFFNSSFDTLLHTFSLPGEVNTFKKINVTDSLIYLLDAVKDTFEILKMNYSGEVESYFTSVSLDETMTAANFMSQDQILFEGLYEIKDISKQLFMRYVHLDSVITYPKSSIDITEFKLHQLGKDTTEIIYHLDGDTTIILSFQYEANVEVFNNSSDTIFNTDIFSAEYLPWLNFPLFFDLDFSEAIPPFEYAYMQKIFTVPYTNTSGFDIAVPGANYRFNASNKKVIFPDFTSSTSEPVNAFTLSVFPNPSSHELHIDPLQDLFNISVYNQLGELIFFSSQHSPIRKIDISSFSPGNYFLSSQDTKRSISYHSKFIKI